MFESDIEKVIDRFRKTVQLSRHELCTKSLVFFYNAGSDSIYTTVTVLGTYIKIQIIYRNCNSSYLTPTCS